MPSHYATVASMLARSERDERRWDVFGATNGDPARLNN